MLKEAVAELDKVQAAQRNQDTDVDETSFRVTDNGNGRYTVVIGTCPSFTVEN